MMMIIILHDNDFVNAVVTVFIVVVVAAFNCYLDHVFMNKQ